MMKEGILTIKEVKDVLTMIEIKKGVITMTVKSLELRIMIEINKRGLQ